jgi:hypothetical protein
VVAACAELLGRVAQELEAALVMRQAGAGRRACGAGDLGRLVLGSMSPKKLRNGRR